MSSDPAISIISLHAPGAPSPEIRYVVQNIFLDGNTWKDSHSFDRRLFVLDTQIGVAVLFGGARITYTHVVMSPEFNEQREWDQFGAITASWKF